jgi:uncharacterized repeat protein (TIGR01451 family)
MELQTRSNGTPVQRRKRKAPPTTWIGTAALVVLLAWPVVARGLPHQSGSITAPPTLKPQDDLCTTEGTDVSGTLPGSPTWTKTNSPYHVTADVTVALDGQLTIQPGVVVCFAQGTGLLIGNSSSAGRLVAEGTSGEPIVFTADTETPARGYWKGIEFSDHSQRNSMDYCVVEYASTGVSSTDSSDDMETDNIHHCTFRHNGVVADGDGPGGALNLQGDGLSLWRNKIYDNELGARLAESFNDEILENEIYDNDGYGLALVAESGSPTETNLISDNQIYKNGGDGIWITDQSAIQAIGNTEGGNELTSEVRVLALAEIHSNVLCGNTGFNLRNQLASEIQATGNWFGTNTPGVDGKIEGSVVFDPWIEMDMTVNPTHLPANGISTAAFALTMIDGDGHAVPDGYEVTVTANLGSLSDPTLSLNSGQATTTYTAGTVAGGVSFGVTDQHQCSTLSFPGELTLEPLAGLDLAVSKDDGAGLVPQSSPDKKYLITYNVSYANTGGIDASGVVLTDDLPDGTQLYAGNGWTCNDGQCTYSIGPLPVGSSGTAPPLVVEVLPDSITDCPDLRNTVTISDDGSHGPDSNPDDNTFPLDTEIPCLPDLVLKKSNNLAGCVGVGEQITYELTYTNAGFAEATGVVLTEQIPDHTSYAGGGWTCEDGTCTRSVSNVPKGGQGSVEFVVEVNDPAPCRSIMNLASVDGQEADLDPADNKAQDTTWTCGLCQLYMPLIPKRHVESPLDLVVSKDDGAGLVPQSSPDKRYLITYVVTYANTGGIDASGVVLTDELPDGTQLYASNGWTCTGDQCTHGVGPLPVGSSGTAPPLVVEVFPDSITGCPDLRNTVTISDDGSHGPDSNPDDNTFPLDTELPCLPDLVLDKSDNLASCVEAGEQITYELAYTNAGFAEATGVVLTEQIPDHTSYAGSGWTCEDGTCTRSVSNVPKGGQSSVEFVVELNDPAPGERIVNTAGVDGQEADLDPGDNKAQEKSLVCPDTIRLFVRDVAVNAETNRVYVANPVNNAVLVVDPSGSRSVIASIPVGDYPLGLDVVTTSNKIYAANSQDGTVTAIRGSDNTPITDRYVGAGASKVAADSGAERVYVTNHGETNNGAAAINSQTDEFEYYYGRLQGAQGRYGIDVDPERDQLFIAARDAGLIAIQDAYSPDQDPQLVKLDPPRVPYVVAFNPATNHLFVTAPDDNKVVVLAPYSIQWHRGAWLTQSGGQRVLLLDRTNAGWIKEIDVGQGAEEGIAVNPFTGYVYVTNTGSNTVSVLQDDTDPSQIQWVEDITVGDQPQGVDVDTKTNTIYVGNAGTRDLTVIENDGTAHTVARTIPLD